MDIAADQMQHVHRPEVAPAGQGFDSPALELLQNVIY